MIRPKYSISTGTVSSSSWGNFPNHASLQCTPMSCLLPGSSDQWPTSVILAAIHIYWHIAISTEDPAIRRLHFNEFSPRRHRSCTERSIIPRGAVTRLLSPTKWFKRAHWWYLFLRPSQLGGVWVYDRHLYWHYAISCRRYTTFLLICKCQVGEKVCLNK